MAQEKNSSTKNIITCIVIIVIAVAAFFGGVFYQKSQKTSTSAQFAQNRAGRFGQNFANRRGVNNRGGFGGAVVGDVVSVDANSLTIKLQDGSSKIVNLSNDTTYSKTDAGSKADLKTGMRIAAIGSTSSDGSITAQNVQLNPMMRPGGRAMVSPSPAK
jgi:hypothetical protein